MVEKKRVPADAPLPPAPLVSKAVLFDKKGECKKCHVKKYLHAPSRLCFPCHVEENP